MKKQLLLLAFLCLACLQGMAQQHKWEGHQLAFLTMTTMTDVQKDEHYLVIKDEKLAFYMRQADEAIESDKLDKYLEGWADDYQLDGKHSDEAQKENTKELSISYVYGKHTAGEYAGKAFLFFVFVHPTTKKLYHGAVEYLADNEEAEHDAFTLMRNIEAE